MIRGLGSIDTQAFRYFGRGSYCKGIRWLYLNASQGSEPSHGFPCTPLDTTQNFQKSLIQEYTKYRI